MESGSAAPAPACRDDPEAPRRRRDPEASRAAILAAAREVFTERGYARATIREIARRAGVTHGLVMRHFGSKERLLLQAMPGPRVIASVVPGDLATLPERLAAAFIAESEGASRGAHAGIALIRSAASGEEAAMPLYAALEQEITDSFRAVLGPGAEVYAGLFGALVIGVLFGRYVAPAGVLAELSPDELEGYLVPVIRALLVTALAQAPGNAPQPAGPPPEARPSLSTNPARGVGNGGGVNHALVRDIPGLSRR